MTTPTKEGLWALTEKEKQTLRLIVRGHDAKSTARSLGLSVHTINERLRDARRKMAVSSSREAARIFLEAELFEAGTANPDLLGDEELGEDGIRRGMDQEAAPIGGAGPTRGRPLIIIGVFLMTFALGLLALATLPQATPSPLPTPVESASTANSQVVDAAREWLAAVDQGQWDKSYLETGAPFRKLNTNQAWVAASEKMRDSLGPVISRTFLREEDLPAPPHGYEVVKFRTSFANRAEAVETVTLEREDGNWRVVGITID